MNDIQLAVTPSREPQQGRSRASYERMIAAAEKLLRERGNNDFTLLEVSKIGKVSIGSIYNRFDSKDDLVRAVQSRVLLAVDREQREIVEAAEAQAGHLHELVPMLIDGIAEALRRHADLMRPMMLQAVSDPIVSEAGKRSYDQVEAMVCSALLSHSAEIRRADPERAVYGAYRIAYAALARDLGFGAAPGYHVAGEWQALKKTLGAMVSAYLGSEG